MSLFQVFFFYDFEFHKIVMGQVTPKETEDKFVTVEYCLLERVISEEV